MCLFLALHIDVFTFSPVKPSLIIVPSYNSQYRKKSTSILIRHIMSFVFSKLLRYIKVCTFTFRNFAVLKIEISIR